MRERRVIEVEGIVQGVGFRPYVHRLAAAGDLRGFVRNDASRVVIDVEGEIAGIDAFCLALTSAPPPHAAISSIHVASAPLVQHDTFRIAPSVPSTRAHRDLAGAPREPARSASAVTSGVTLAIPPDIATCATCVAEIFDVTNRRYRHPFTSCTDCGPRFTIVTDTPFDRERTTMSVFPRCPACEDEYHSPDNRRFHAETIACPACGPVLTAFAFTTVGENSTTASATPSATRHVVTPPLDVASTVLRGGGIVAIKALGGFQLACDATDADAVARLRRRKSRRTKPLAMMLPDTYAVRCACELSEEEERAIVSAARPVVLLVPKAGACIAHNIAPDNARVGVMLPSSPLHHLLLAAVDRPLVMTSGNRSGEPVCIDDASAFDALGGVADLVLTHDRDIALRCDDSVVHVIDDQARTIRRARGYVPRPVPIPMAANATVLALGGHLKNTVCIIRDRHAHLSAHVGDLDSVPSRGALQAAITSTIAFAGSTPTVIAHDLHPDYATSLVAGSVADLYGIRDQVAVQHHHAHAAACMAEHGIREPAIGVVFDGAGYGTDGATWGGEFLLVNGATFVRAGHMAYVALPGGDDAARTPWRSALAHLAHANTDVSRGFRRRPVSVSLSSWELAQQVVLRQESAHHTSSVGRLFDAVASLLSICQVSDFEGHAAMALETVATAAPATGYCLSIASGAPWTIDPSPIVRGVLSDIRKGRTVHDIASTFHTSVRDMIVLGCERIREDTGVSAVVLSGGVFMNRQLAEQALTALRARRFQPYIPRDVPCNDGGLALGQAYVAACALEDELCA